MYFPAAVILQPDETLPSWIRHFVLSNEKERRLHRLVEAALLIFRLFFGFSVIKKVRYITNVTFYR